MLKAETTESKPLKTKPGDAKPVKITPLHPISVIGLAWAISGKYSKNEEEQEKAQDAETYFREVQKAMLADHPAYANEIASLLLGNSRTFALIMRDRDYDLANLEVLKQNKVKTYQSLQSFTGSLQGVFPRLAGITIGGTSLSLLVSSAFPSISASVSDLLLGLFGGVGYVVSEVVASKIGGDKLNDCITYFEGEKKEKFRVYLDRSERALKRLLDDVIGSYQEHVDGDYDLTSDERTKEVRDLMAGALKEPLESA